MIEITDRTIASKFLRHSDGDTPATGVGAGPPVILTSMSTGPKTARISDNFADASSKVGQIPHKLQHAAAAADNSITRFRQAPAVDIRQSDPATLSGERCGDRRAQPAPGAQHKRRSTVKIQVHAQSSSSVLPAPDG
jgi:hypothetical protein